MSLYKAVSSSAPEPFPRFLALQKIPYAEPSVPARTLTGSAGRSAAAAAAANAPEQERWWRLVSVMHSELGDRWQCPRNVLVPRLA